MANIPTQPKYIVPVPVLIPYERYRTVNRDHVLGSDTQIRNSTSNKQASYTLELRSKEKQGLYPRSNIRTYIVGN